MKKRGSQGDKEKSKDNEQDCRVDAEKARTTLGALEPNTELSPSNKAHNLLKEQKRTDSEGGKSDGDSV